MSGDVVNLRRARKAKHRAAEADAAAEKRLRFGRSKAQRAFEATVDARDKRLFEGHRRDGSAQSNPDHTDFVERNAGGDGADGE